MPFYLLICTLLFLNACSPMPDMELKNTYWSLAEINGKEVTYAEHQPEAHLVFHINDTSLHGSDGCNRFQGSYIQTQDAFRFQALASTKMACAEGMEQADKFLKVLKETDNIDISGNQLIFYHLQAEIARFEAKEDY